MAPDNMQAYTQGHIQRDLHLHVSQHRAILDHARLDQNSQLRGLLPLYWAPILCRLLVWYSGVCHLLAERACTALASHHIIALQGVPKRASSSSMPS